MMTPRLFIQLVGAEETMLAIDAFGVKVAVAAEEAAFDEATYELALTKERVPVETGSLKATGRVERYPISTFDVSSAIVYGGPMGTGKGQTQDVDYAVVVHEDLFAHHPHGEAKYVENVVNEEFGSGRAFARMAENISMRMAGFLGSFASKAGNWTSKGGQGGLTGSRPRGR